MIILKRHNESHSKENINILLIEILWDFDLIKRLKYFTTDNTNSNDLIINYIFQIFLSQFTSFSRFQRRLRYFGYIFNLASDIYLYGNNFEFFEMKIIVQITLTREQEEFKI
jgi:hypothetical protein